MNDDTNQPSEKKGLPDARTILSELVQAIRGNDLSTVDRIVNQHDEIMKDMPIASFEMSDWRIQESGKDADTDELTVGQQAASMVTISESAYGFVFRATPPGATLCQEVTVEFDRGSMAIRPYLMDEVHDEALLTVKTDDRGAHISRDFANSNQFIAGPDTTDFERTSDWEPEAPESRPRP